MSVEEGNKIIAEFEKGTPVKIKGMTYRKGVNDNSFYVEVASMKVPEAFMIGEYVFAYYYDPYQKVELYFGQIMTIGQQYCKVKLFVGEELYPDRIYGIYNDVCVGDIQKVNTKLCEGKTLELILQNRSELGFHPMAHHPANQ